MSTPNPFIEDAHRTAPRFSLIDTTLREGEQFADAFLTRAQKLDLARLLDAFGIEYIELTSPAAGPGSREACEAVAGLGLDAKVLTHIRCHMDDARLAVESGVDGVNMMFGTSELLRRHSHGKAVHQILDQALEVIAYVQDAGLEVRFSSEDSFRSDLVDLLTLYRAVDAAGVDRVGVADTVGVAHPQQVFQLVRTLRQIVGCGIEFHGHDDTGCAVANTFCALEAGATHLDVSVLGLGERNGIASLEGLVARLYAVDPDALRERYRLPLLQEIVEFVSRSVGVAVPFNSCITGSAAFSHRAGIHVKAMLENPRTYEVLNPDDFGVSRRIQIAHHLTGWNAVRHRCRELGLQLDDRRIKDVTRRIKTLAEERPISNEIVDRLLHEEASSFGETLPLERSSLVDPVLEPEPLGESR